MKRSNQIDGYLVCRRKSAITVGGFLFELGDQQRRPETSATTRRTILRAAGLLGLTGAGAAALGSCSEASRG